MSLSRARSREDILLDSCPRRAGRNGQLTSCIRETGGTAVHAVDMVLHLLPGNTVRHLLVCRYVPYPQARVHPCRGAYHSHFCLIVPEAHVNL